MKRVLLAGAALFALTACQNMDALAPWIEQGNQAAKAAGYDTDSRLAGAIKETLSISSDRATNTLSRTGAFDLPLPAPVQSVASNLERVGLGRYVDQVRDAMNRGAEKAAAEAAPVFKNAIREMTVTDALGIVRGGDTAATDYFRGRTESRLAERYRPIIENSLRETGFYDQYRTLLNAYNRLPMANKPDLHLENYVVDTSLDRLYSEIGAQEALIRQDPVSRGSALIGAVFGGQD